MSLQEISLFSGIGGISLACQWANIHPIQFCEIDPYCQKVLAKNFPGVPIENDVTKFDGTRFRGRNTILTAGFPCQPHSVAGSRKASGDDRDLWSEVVRVLSETQSRWFLGENVPGLLSSESGRFFGRVVNDLESLGYRVGWTVYGASDVGAVHRRHRIFIVAYSKSGENGQRGRREMEGAQSCREGFNTTLSPCSADATDAKGKSSNGGRFEPRSQALSKPGNGDSALRLACDTSGRRLPGEPRGRSGQESQNGYTPVQGGDWRAWDVKPVVRLSDDGIPGSVARDRLKALGNSVCPQQVFPILQAIANFES